MVIYALRRCFSVIVVLFIISLLVFAITQILPGNVADVIAGQFATPDVIAALQRKLGLDLPWYVQCWRWLSGILVGNFGNSLIMDRPGTRALVRAAGIRHPSIHRVHIRLPDRSVLGGALRRAA